MTNDKSIRSKNAKVRNDEREGRSAEDQLRKLNMGGHRALRERKRLSEHLGISYKKSWSF